MRLRHLTLEVTHRGGVLDSTIERAHHNRTLAKGVAHLSRPRTRLPPSLQFTHLTEAHPSNKHVPLRSVRDMPPCTARLPASTAKNENGRRLMFL